MIRSIHIDAVLNGFIVRVGCQTVVFQGASFLVAALLEYLKNPEETERLWLKDSINTRHTMGSGLEAGVAVGFTGGPPQGATGCDVTQPTESPYPPEGYGRFGTPPEVRR